MAVALIAAGVVAAGTIAYGAYEKSKAKKAQAALLAARPKYTIPQSEQDIQNLAESQANQGMSGAARQQLQNNTDRGYATGANAILMGGGDANGIGNLAEKSQEGVNQNAIYDDQRRLSNLSSLYGAYTRNSANQDKAWSINNNQPWKDQMAANSQDLQYANGVIGQGIGMAGSAASGAAGALARNAGGNNTGAGMPTVMGTPNVMPGSTSGMSMGQLSAWGG